VSTLASIIIRDLFANLPAASIAGRLFFASDTGAVYRDNGATWDLLIAGGGGGGSGVSLISEVVTSGSQTSVTFSGIAATYRDLLIRVRGHSNEAATSSAISIQFNADTGSNYDYSFYGFNTAFFQLDALADDHLFLGWIQGNTGPASAGSATEFTVYDYRGTTFQKHAAGRGAFKADVVTATNMLSAITNGYWRNTAAITAVKVFLSGGPSFTDGSVVSLYGGM